MKLAIATDHNGVNEKREIINFLTNQGYEVLDLSQDNNANDDYPDFAFAVCKKVVEKEDNLGILICGNGIGMSIAANKVKGIRAARAVTIDDAFKAKNHNGANVIALSSEVDIATTKEIIDLLKKINDFGTTILVTTHNENIVNNLQKRVITLKDGKIVNDQKNNGVYELDATPIPKKPVRKMQMPGHALKAKRRVI